MGTYAPRFFVIIFRYAVRVSGGDLCRRQKHRPSREARRNRSATVRDAPSISRKGGGLSCLPRWRGRWREATDEAGKGCPLGGAAGFVSIVGANHRLAKMIRSSPAGAVGASLREVSTGDPHPVIRSIFFECFCAGSSSHLPVRSAPHRLTSNIYNLTSNPVP